MRKGMAVVTPLGVVGQVVAVTARTAKVLLLTDPNSGIDVLVQRTRAAASFQVPWRTAQC